MITGDSVSMPQILMSVRRVKSMTVMTMPIALTQLGATLAPANLDLKEMDTFVLVSQIVHVLCIQVA